MDVDSLTIGQFKQLQALFNTVQQDQKDAGLSDMIGKKVIVRTYSAGVWFGLLEKKAGNEVIIGNARRLWEWKAAKSISLSGVAVHGVDESGCRFAPPVERVWLEAIELIPASDIAIQSIEGVEDAVAR